MKLSVVIATLNRLPYLRQCLASIEQSCAGIEHEIIIVDGGSADGTLDYLRGLPDIVLIEQGMSLGAVAAYNAGFAIAEGDYVAWLNDDCEAAGDVLAQSCCYLDEHPDCGQVAIPFSEGAAPFILTMHIGTPNTELLYANFGVTRRDIGELVGWWGDYLRHYGGDCELSAQIWKLGFTVDQLPSGHIIHHAVPDRTRQPNREASVFRERWENEDFGTVAR